MGLAQPRADRYGKPLLAVAQVDAARAAAWPPTLAPDEMATARFDDGPTLLGMKVAENGRDFLLYWQSDAHTFRDLLPLSISSTAVTGVSARWIVFLATAIFAPPTGCPANVHPAIHTEFLDACSGGETVSVVTGWYQYLANGQRRPRLDAPGDVALAGAYTCP